jgi:hypothetical protein
MLAYVLCKLFFRFLLLQCGYFCMISRKMSRIVTMKPKYFSIVQPLNSLSYCRCYSVKKKGKKMKKLTDSAIRERLDKDVERFSNVQTGIINHRCKSFSEQITESAKRICPQAVSLIWRLLRETRRKRLSEEGVSTCRKRRFTQVAKLSA